MIAAEKANYPIRWMCQMLKVSRSGFYRWLHVKPSQRQLQDRILAQQVADIELCASLVYEEELSSVLMSG